MSDMHIPIDQLEFDSFFIGNTTYHFTLSDRVKAELLENRISTNQIEETIFYIPSSLYKELGNEDFLIDCQATKTRLVICKVNQNFEILLARQSNELPIY